MHQTGGIQNTGDCELATVNCAPIAYLIVTYNGADHIKRLLRSISKESMIVVFDNASTDATVDIALKYTNHIIESPENLGYAAGINRGIEYILKTASHRLESIDSYIFILNQDTELPPAFNFQLSTFSSLPVIIQPRILLPNGNVNVDELAMNVFGFVYPPDFDTPPQGKQPKKTTFFSGAAFLLNLKKYQKIGPFDESLFMYYEDVDYAFRIALAGEQIVFDPTWTVTHHYTSSTTSWRKTKALLKNRTTIIRRSFPSLWRKLLLHFEGLHSPRFQDGGANPPFSKELGEEWIVPPFTNEVREEYILPPFSKGVRGECILPPFSKGVRGFSPADRKKLAQILFPALRLGFDTKQFPPLQRRMINSVFKPIGYVWKKILESAF